MSWKGILLRAGADVVKGTGGVRDWSISGKVTAENIPDLLGRGYYVNSNMTASGNGNSWDTGFKTVTEALAVADDYDVIFIKQGVYDEGAVLNITQTGLKLIGCNTTENMYGTTSLKASSADHIIITIAANQVEIANLSFIQNNAKAVISIDHTAAVYKTHIHDCHFGSATATYGVYAGATFDAVDTIIERCHFTVGAAVGVYFNATRSAVIDCVFNLAAGGTAIQHYPNTADRPYTRYSNNNIMGVNSTDTGILISNTPTLGCLTISGNIVENVATPITLSKYTAWYEGNYWGADDWRYHQATGRDAALARGADGSVFYMDLNIATSGLDGKCWASAFSTVAAAVTACATDIAAHRNWARRNTIYIIGDEINEDITVVPEKTDLVGVGTDLCAYPRMMHSWAIAAAKKGVRFFNIGWMNDAADVALALPAGCHGAELHNCHFIKESAGTHGFRITTSANVKLIGCEFLPDGAGGLFVTAAVDIVGVCYDLEIRDCYIEGTIAVAADSAAFGSRIVNSTLKATAIIVDDDGSTITVAGCNLVTAANSGNAFADTAMDMNLNLAVGNYLVSADSNGPFPNVIVLA